MKNQPIYRTVFNQLHENGTLDRVKDSVIAANVKFPEDTDYDFAWIHEIKLWRIVHNAYVRDNNTLFSIPLPCLKKFRCLVTEYLTD